MGAEQVPLPWSILSRCRAHRDVHQRMCGSAHHLSIYRGEVGRGMDHVLAFALETDAMPISIALSELAYGVDLGYIGQSSV
jgi:hypothetical protein